MHTTHNIALGFGNNVDYVITMNSSLLQDSILRLHIHSDDIHFYSDLMTEKEVLCTLLHCIQTQVGGERYIGNSQVLQQLSDHFPHKKSVGGTAARAANILAEEGIGSLLHCISYTDEDKQFIHPLVDVVSNRNEESSCFHCIIQYNKGLHILIDDLSIVAKQSNRIILNNNPVIRTLPIHPLFFLRAQTCKLLLLSGLNAIHDAKILETRLLEIIQGISIGDKTKTIIYEDGCFHIANHRMLVIKLLCPHLSVYSMNEEEWRELVKTPFVTEEQKIEALILAGKILGVPTVIVHTQAFVMACGLHAKKYQEALQKGVDVATCHLLGEADNPLEKPLCPEGLQMQKLCKHYENLCCVPSYVIDKETLTTVGLGDAFIAGFLSIGVPNDD
jgi:ADP-dependent phosphofructokinase/glucokinase